MLHRMPWLNNRRRLLILGCIDYLIIIILFIILQINQVINTNFLSINIFSFCWIISSYSLDKYSIVEDEFNFNIANKFLRTTKIAITSGILLKLVIVLFTIINSDVGDGKWPIFIFLVSIISFLYEILHSYIIKKYIAKKLKWISIYSNPDSKSLFLRSSNLIESGYFKSIHINKITKILGINSNDYGFILEDINLLSNEEKKILINFKNEGYKILSLVSWFEKYLHRYPSEFISSTNILNELLTFKQSSTSKRIKRFSEFWLSLLLIILVSPIIILASILIKIEDKGPILYSQKRNGFRGKVFTIYKLRSMKINAEREGIRWSTKNDARITKVGYWLRKTRVDELPQLFSVLKGEMSLIGPRPERPEIDEMLTQKVPNYKLRYLVRPGLSGWAQVNYPYGSSVEDTKMKFSYDIYYIKNLSTFFDLLIFLETIRLVFNFRGSQPKESR
tara:strand:- start:8592 stop:9938 length:1347 start_codon:yes stop_codon:yes gene_type:complete